MITRNEGKVLFLAIAVRMAVLFTSFYLADKIIHFDSLSEFIKLYSRRWDGNSYALLAENGYATAGPNATLIVFPPLYPLVIRFLKTFFINTEVSAFLASNTFFLVAVVIFYRLLLLDFSKNRALISTLLLTVFPTSYFFSSGFPESLFLLLFCLTFYFARVDNFLSASIFAALASLTRPFGFLFWPSLLVEWFINRKKISHFPVEIFVFMTISVSVYLSLNSYLFGKPLAFSQFLHNTWGKTLTFPWRGIIGSWKTGFYTQNDFGYKYFVGYGEAISATLAWVFIFIGFLKKSEVKLSYLIYYILGVIASTSTGFLLSVPRYLLSLPPFFIIFSAFIRNRFSIGLYLTFSLPLLIYLSSLFALGSWTF